MDILTLNPEYLYDVRNKMLQKTLFNLTVMLHYIKI